jgi:hypothetical protein
MLHYAGVQPSIMKDWPDWPKDKPLPNPYAKFSFIVVVMLTPREVERLRQEAKEATYTSPSALNPSQGSWPIPVRTRTCTRGT